MNSSLWIVCGSFAIWGLVYVVIGIVGKVKHQMLTGAAVILLAASMPVIERNALAGWLMVAAALPPAVAALRIRFRELPARKN